MFKTIVITLAVVGLLDQCVAFRLSASKAEGFDGISDFIFKADDQKDGAAMNATEPYITGSGDMRNKTAWEFVSGSGYKAIQTTIDYKELNCTYTKAKAVYGPFSKRGEFVALLGQKVFKLAVKTTMNGEKCQLTLEISAPGLTADMDASQLGIVGQVFTTHPDYKREISTKLGANLEKPMSQLLSILGKHYFAKFVNLSTLCKNIQAATPAHFPEPVFKK